MIAPPPETPCPNGNPDWDAFRAVRDWPDAAAPADVSVQGVNLGHATRRATMLAVAAAVRREAFPGQAAREAAFRTAWGLTATSGGSGAAWAQAGLAGLRALPDRLALGRMARQQRQGAGTPLLLVKDTRRLRPLMAHLHNARFLRMHTGLGTQGGGAVPVAPGPSWRRGVPDGFRDALAAGLAAGLAARGLDLDAAALDAIVGEAAREAARVRVLNRVFDRLRPAAVVLHDDTSPEGLTVALTAAARGLPAVTLAHGLDCERFFLDAVYAHFKCVWGPARAATITSTGAGDPAALRVTGNPGHDGLDMPRAPALGGDTWLWVTRPHVSRKAFQPSRFVHEGADILAALLDTLKHHPTATLTVKPHPTDYADVYARQVADSGLGARVHIRHDSLDTLLPRARVVISEDSTAALDACLAGKPLIHSHFAPAPPALPLVEYRAALPGGDAAALADSLGRLDALADGATADPDLARRLFEGQRAFIAAHAGPLDGQAGARVRAVLDEAIATFNV